MSDTHREPVRVLVVEDHHIVRHGLRAMLSTQSDLAVVAESADAADALRLYESSRADIVLMDLRLRDGSGIDAIRDLRREHPRCRIVVLTNYSDEEHVSNAVAAGASGYVLKDADPSQIVDALRSVAAGRRYLSPEASARLVERAQASPLTPREMDVMALLVHGHRNRSIAATLGVTEETVKGHVKNILGKLGVQDRTEAATEAIRRGLVALD